MTKAELLKVIQSLQAKQTGRSQIQEVFAELETHRVELEMQNRELRESQGLLEESRDRYADLYDFAPVAYVTLDSRGTIIEINLFGADVLGRERSRLIDIPISLLLATNDDRDRIRAHIHECISDKHRTVTELRIQTKDGAELPVEILSTPTMTPEGRIVLRSVLIDISERKRAEEDREGLLRERGESSEAEGASWTRDEFLATLSHELETPLAAIQGYIQLIDSHDFREEDVRRGLEGIERSVRTQYQAVNDMLDLERIRTGELKVEMRSVVLPSLLRSVLEGVCPEARRKSIEVKVLIDESAERVSGDPARIEQIISSLLSNAMRFTPEGGRVDVSLEHISGRGGGALDSARLTVRDNGLGIHPDLLPRVFEHTRQVESSASRRLGGLRLGLALVRHLVELHGGSVHAQSGGEDKGAAFTMELPLEVSPSARAVERNAPRQEQFCNPPGRVSG
ncbi:MAG TPA: PAS domain-containing sensor histidine kinase [Planctomycetota bacterium]|nr:PAS domain-containing sensor histidine kinase [Planctomycetota bacterium]